MLLLIRLVEERKSTLTVLVRLRLCLGVHGDDILVLFPTGRHLQFVCFWVESQQPIHFQAGNDVVLDVLQVLVLLLELGELLLLLLKLKLHLIMLLKPGLDSPGFSLLSFFGLLDFLLGSPSLGPCRQKISGDALAD